MKSWTAAPSLRNSGLLQTWNGRLVWRRIASRTLPAVPTGTVLFVMTIFSGPSAGMFRPIVSATASTCCRSAEPSSPGGVPTAMKMISASATAAGHVGGEREPRFREVPLDQHLQPRLVDRDLSRVQPCNLPGVDVAAHDIVSGFREAGADHESNVAGADDGDSHDSDCSFAGLASTAQGRKTSGRASEKAKAIGRVTQSADQPFSDGHYTRRVSTTPKAVPGVPVVELS
jgi:hypothetical protein